jgi:ribosome-associated translation inhibitor RaiA
MNVAIRGTRIELTDDLRAFIEDKLNDAQRKNPSILLESHRV